MGEHNLPQTSVDLHNLDNRHVESGIRALADSLGEGLVVIQHNRVVFINEKLLEILDMPRNSVLGESLNELLPQDHESRDYIDIRARRERGESISYPEEIRLRLETGRTAVMRNRATLIQWQGEPATVHFLEDITHRKAMENQLLQQKEVNAILADAVRRILASPLSLKDTAAAVLDSAMRLTGSRSGVLLIDDAGRQVLSERRCEGQCLHCIVPEVMRHIESDEVLMNRRRPGRIPGAFYLNEGLERAKDCLIGGKIRNILRVPARNDSTVSGQIILADTPTTFGPWDLDNMEKIAEVLNLALLRVQTIAELENAKITAEKEADAKSLFLANVSHEIRSPLNGVLMMASLLRDSDLSEEQKEILGVVMFSAQTIDRLIRDLTDLTQIRTGKFTVHNDFFDFSELVRHLVDINRPEAARKGLELVSDIGPKLDYIYGDRERIGQIIANLLINAVKYTDRGHVGMDAVEEDGNLVISVKDTGIGIPEGQQQAVFNLFHQGVPGDGRRVDGTGIGLAVVKELTQIMKGRVSLESRYGEGSRFTVILPLQEPSADRRQSDREATDAFLPESARILVVEDEGVNRLYIRTLLERDGWDIDEAADGVEAVSLARGRSYDLVLMDISMPRMDGLEASTRIREIHPFLPILAITAHAYEEDRRRILEAGLNDIILKPIDERVLKRRLRRYLNKS